MLGDIIGVSIATNSMKIQLRAAQMCCEQYEQIKSLPSNIGECSVEAQNLVA